ncbi:hypothetical protein D9758_018533 [Tetrapyrgos nigripes]|uniref:Myb/SANT-like domain-containing protein n=1 Tax=Tetrapyrgos nigripes TaxID=182062 RepID=A0A8H5BT50_9AGAR|nr:hypothetical protein D9758_018533 [Tetrapyrgos nigripes]
MSLPGNISEDQDLPISQVILFDQLADRPGIQDLWNSDIDLVLLQHLDQAKKERNSCRDTFGALVWAGLVKHLAEQGHPTFTQEQLKDCFHILKKHGYTLGQSLPSSTAPLQTAVDPNIDPTLANPLSSSIPPPTISFPHHTTPISAPAAAPPQATSGQAVWTVDAEALLIDFLINAKGQGLMSENNLKNKVYGCASRHLHENGYNFSKSQVKSHWTRFKAQFKVVAKLFWDAYLKGYKKAQPFCKNPFPHYDEITDMIGHSTATGAFALSSENSPSNLQKAKSDASSEESSDDNSDDDDVNPKTPTKERHTSVSMSAPRKHVRISAGAQALKTMSSSVAALTEGLTPPLIDSPASKKRAFDVVCAKEGLSPYSLSKAHCVFRGSGEVACEYLSFNSADESERTA